MTSGTFQKCVMGRCSTSSNGEKQKSLSVTIHQVIFRFPLTQPLNVTKTDVDFSRHTIFLELFWIQEIIAMMLSFSYYEIVRRNSTIVQPVVTYLLTRGRCFSSSPPPRAQTAAGLRTNTRLPPSSAQARTMRAGL